jgi:hypothetical protein
MARDGGALSPDFDGTYSDGQGVDRDYPQGTRRTFSTIVQTGMEVNQANITT